ncbi:hypothetical protein LR48_Vigan09g097300 [Vigna angularis]|uniref:Uncharacterized protein n=1 Tax=Phaseolus angularis TaxID=3914 RepID=A0A0L9VCD1_PHAAN|nr:hypothetical protein LR48_Vigan09g097300 [Vigna angularis]
MGFRMKRWMLEVMENGQRLCKLAMRIVSHSESLWRDALCQGHSHSELVHCANNLRGFSLFEYSHSEFERYVNGWGQKNEYRELGLGGYPNTLMIFHSHLERIDACGEVVGGPSVGATRRPIARWCSFAHRVESFPFIRLDFHLDGSKSWFHHRLGGCRALFGFSL